VVTSHTASYLSCPGFWEKWCLRIRQLTEGKWVDIWEEQNLKINSDLQNANIKKVWALTSAAVWKFKWYHCWWFDLQGMFMACHWLWLGVFQEAGGWPWLAGQGGLWSLID
jgi:hypothetical protein